MEYNAEDKYKSMLRAYNRLKIINTNTGNKHGNTEAKDATENFFNQCYHLKDWIKRDSSINLSTDLEKYINNSQHLSIAADYCNNFKRAGLDNTSRLKKNIENLSTHVKFDLTKNGFIASSKLEVTIDGEKYNSLDLAKNCIKEWNIFLKTQTKGKKINVSNP